MNSRKCTATVERVTFRDKVVCGATTFYEDNDQCPQYCGTCGSTLNSDYVMSREEIIGDVEEAPKGKKK